MTPFPDNAEPEPFPRLLFGRHHGYDLREQWISKGLLALARAEDAAARARLFTFPEASERFGIGPGMVRALRYWFCATGLIAEQVEHGSRRNVPALTPLGTVLARYDPFLERAGSLWLLHARLAGNLLLAPTFSWFFQCFIGAAPFTKEECLDALQTWTITNGPRQQVPRETLRKDVECLLRQYTSSPSSSPLSPEQALLASPFRRLHLLECLPFQTNAGMADRSTRSALSQYRLCPPRPEAIPALIVLALLLEANPQVRQVSLTHLLYRQRQPGRICSLKRETLVDAFRQIQEQEPSWSPRPLTVKGQPWVELPTVTPEQVLLRYYTQP